MIKVMIFSSIYYSIQMSLHRSVGLRIFFEMKMKMRVHTHTKEK